MFNSPFFIASCPRQTSRPAPPGTAPAGRKRGKIDLFIDGSILDIFVNDRWAQSIRVFPLSETADGISVFSDGRTRILSLDAWALASGGAGSGGIADDGVGQAESLVDVYDMQGRRVRAGVERASAVEGLDSGVYIAGGKKYVVR